MRIILTALILAVGVLVGAAVPAVSGFVQGLLISAGLPPTVFNLGYDETVASQWPYVKDLSGGIASGHPRRRVRGKEGFDPNASKNTVA